MDETNHFRSSALRPSRPSDSHWNDTGYRGDRDSVEMTRESQIIDESEKFLPDFGQVQQRDSMISETLSRE